MNYSFFALGLTFGWSFLLAAAFPGFRAAGFFAALGAASGLADAFAGAGSSALGSADVPSSGAIWVGWGCTGDSPLFSAERARLNRMAASRDSIKWSCRSRS